MIFQGKDELMRPWELMLSTLCSISQELLHHSGEEFQSVMQILNGQKPFPKKTVSTPCWYEEVI